MKQITIAAAVMAMAVIVSSPVFAKDQPEPNVQENALEIPLRTKTTTGDVMTEAITDPERRTLATLYPPPSPPSHPIPCAHP